MRSGLGLLRRIYTVGLRVTLPRHRVVSRWLRMLHSVMEVGLDLVLTDFPDAVGVRLVSPLATSYHSAVL